MLNLNQVFPLEEIIGIGPVLAEALAELGYIHDIDLLAIPENALINHISQIDGLSASMISHSILPQARFLRLPGSNGAIADALVDASYLRYSDFLGVRTARIEMVISKVNVNEDTSTNSALACEMLLTAVQLAVTGSVRVIVVDGETQKAVIGAVVSFAGDRRKSEIAFTKRSTDKRGIVDYEGISPQPTAFSVSAAGYTPQNVLAVVRGQGHTVCKALMTTVPRDLTNFDEFLGGRAARFTSLPLVHQTTELVNLPSRPPIFIESIKDDEAIVGSLWFREEWDRVIIPRLKVPISDLPEDAKKNDVLVPEADGWRHHPDGFTASEFRQELIRDRSNTQQGGVS